MAFKPFEYYTGKKGDGKVVEYGERYCSSVEGLVGVCRGVV